MLGPGTIPKPHPDVVATMLPEGEVVLLQLDTKCYFTLNATGSRIWELMDGDRSLEDIGREIERGYDVTGEDARLSVADLFGQLVAERLVVAHQRGATANSTA